METSWMKRLFLGLAAVSGSLFSGYSRAAEVTARYVRLTVSDWPRTAGGVGLAYPNSGLAIGEFELRTGGDYGTKVAWPEGTSLTSNPNKTDGEGKDKIWDGVYQGSKFYRATPGSDGNYTFTFSLGAPVTFSGYAIYGSDQDGRSPMAWTLSTSEDGETWRTMDTRTLTAAQVKGWGYTVEKKFALRTARRTVAGAEAWVQAGAWQQDNDDGTTAMVDKPSAGVPVEVTVTGGASLSIDEAELPLSLSNLSVAGEGTLALNFGRLGMAEADYLSLPMSKTLLTSEQPLPAELQLQLAPLKYGAYAVLQNTGAAVVATVRPPRDVWWEEGSVDGLISINFSHGNTGKLTGDGVVGLAGYEAHVANWDAFTTASATNQPVHLRSFSERTMAQAGTAIDSALTYTAYGTWGDDRVQDNSLQRGYLDDNVVTRSDSDTLSLKVPASWTSYTAVIYSATDSADFPFFARRINNDWYTYNEAGTLEKMVVAEGATPDLTAGQWGRSTKRGTYEEGGNVMVVTGLTGETFDLWFPGGYVDRYSVSGGRGCLAALQLIQKSSYDLDLVVTRMATAPVGTVAWADLEWVDENGNPAAAPTAADAAAVVLTGETVLTATPADVAPKFLSIYGNGHAVTLPAEADFAPGGWAFVSDTTVVLPTAECTLPTTLATYPRRVRYDYFYEGDLTLLPSYEQAFTAGFSGSVTPQGGLAEFSSGTVTVTTLTANASGSTLIFSGDSVVTAADGLAVSTGSLIFRDQAQATVGALELLKNATGGSASLTISDEALVTVTGSVATLAAGSGTSVTRLAGQGKLLAKQAVLSLCDAAAATSGAYSLTVEDAAELWVKGLATTSSSASAPALTLNGGRLMLGSAGLAATGTQQVTMTWGPEMKLGAWEDCELSGAAGFCASLTGLEALKLASEPEATLTFTSLEPFFLQPSAATYLYAPWAGDSGSPPVRAKGFTFQIDDLVYPADQVGASQIKVTQIAVCTNTSTGLGSYYGVLVDEGSNRVLAISGLSTSVAGSSNNYPPRSSGYSSMADFPFASGVVLMRGKQYTVWPVNSTSGIVVGAEMPAGVKAAAGLNNISLIADSTATADGRALHPSVRLMRTGKMMEQVQVLRGGVTFRGAGMTLLPALTVADGCSLTFADCAPALPSVAMGNETTLTLAGGTPNLQSITFGQKCVVRVPMGESMEQSGYLEMAAGQAMPDFSEVIVTFVLDPARNGGKTLFPLLPLVLAACDEAATPAVRGYAVVNNTNNAIGSATFAYRSALLGPGLYVQFTGNDVFSQHSVELTKSAEGAGYPLLQSTVDAFPYHLFEGKVAGARLLIPDGGIRLPHASFSGTSIRVVAQGDTLAPLLVTEDATFSAPVTFDLSRWGEDFAAQLTRGAVKDVPVSFCLMSGAIRTTALADFAVDFGGYTLPAGYTAAVEVGEDGLYYVVYSTRKARTVSVNFSERTRTFDGAATGVYTLPVAAWNNFAGTFSSSVLTLSTRTGLVAGQAKDGDLPMVLLASASAMNVDAAQPAPLLQSRLEDGPAQTIRISSMPFEAYRVALIFANDLGGAAYVPVTVNGVVYAMDGAGYTRRSVAGDEAAGWGTTDRPTDAAPIRLGQNAWVTDTLTARQVELALPALEYAVRYAGVAAIQVIEAPLPEEHLPPARTYTATIPEGEVAWESLSFTITEDADANAGATTGPWVSGERNTLRLLCAGNSELTLPDGFVASAIRFSNPADDGTTETPPAPTGALVLNAPGSVDSARLDAAGLKNLTLTFPCTGIDVVAPTGTLRVEAAFDNNGQPYTIAAGQTLALGENCGIVTNLDDNGTASLTINTASAGTLRRDYPVTQTKSQAVPDLTCAFKNGVVSNTNNSTYRLLIEAGDRLQHRSKFHPPLQKDWVYTQTGGYASFSNNDGDGGILLPNNNGAVNKTMTLNVSGNSDSRLETTKIWAWRAGTVVNINVSGEATLALGSGGLRKDNGRSISATFTEQGTLELMAATCENGAGTDCTVTFQGGRLTTRVAESNCQLPLLFTGTADQPTRISPLASSTILLSAAAPSTPAEAGVVQVTQGILAVSNANALANAAVTVLAGATFEARNLSGSASGALTFEPGSCCSVTTASEVTYPVTVQVAASLAMADKSQVSFRLNGTYHTADSVTVNESAGTLTFADNGIITQEGVTWRTDCTEGIWQENISTPWQDNKAYLNGAAVTFGSVTGRAPEDRVQVSLMGVVRPGSMTFDTASADTYVFKAGGEGVYLDASAFAASVPVGNGQRWELPISTGSATSVPSGSYITLGLFGKQISPTTYRLIPSNGTIIQSGTAAAAWHFLENGAGTDSFTWLLKPGETQSVGMCNGQMNGSGRITVMGGGTLSAEGQCQGTNWNSLFSGYFEVQDGSTLDFLMNRGNGDAGGDQSPFFSALDLSRPAFVLTNGATLRFSGCRGILGGEQNVTEANRVPKTLISLGYNATVAYNSIYSNRVQIAPHSFLLKGEGATLSIGDVTGKTATRRGLCLPKGATIAVAGIGDAGDPADPATQPESGTATAPYALQRGITATIRADEGTGLACWNNGVANAEGVTLQVGQGSNLCVTANFVAPEGAATLIPLIKTGLGRLQLDYPAISLWTHLTVREGTVGGAAAFTNLDSQLVMMDGTTIEGGLALSVLDFRGNATLALDPTGRRPLTAEAVSFASGKQYTVVPLTAEIAEAQRGQAAIRVMGWRGATNLSAVNFTLSAALREKGYGLEVREDGLYLMKSTVYVREIDFGTLDPANPLTTYTLAWFSPTGWYRQEDPAKTPRDYDPDEDEATTVLFVLPEAFDPSATGAMTPPHLTLQLTRAAAFAEVRFAAKHTENGVVTFKPLTVGVAYHYNLTGEEMPAANGSRRFMWVPTLVVTRADDSLSEAQLTASVPAGYSATQSDATVVVYASAAQPAINLNFTGKLTGDASWVGVDAAPCGAVPFSGIYWNNLSTTIGAGSDYIGAEGGYLLFRKNATIAGLEASAEGQLPTVAVTYTTYGAGRLASRRGDANSPLAAGYFKAGRISIPTALREQGNFSPTGCWGGWQLRIAEVPFATYDLYLLFAGESDGPTEYSNVRIKLGNGRWQTFGFVNGWTAPVDINDIWAGSGGLVKGAFVDGKNMLHLRIAATAGTDLEICPADSEATEDSNGHNGLAAIQIVRCDDGGEMLRVGAGDWSDATGWQRLNDRERWVDSTLEVPRAVRIPTVTELSADMLAAAPYLRFTGTSTMQMTGSAGVLSTGAVDLVDLSAGSFVDFTEDLFSQPPNVLLGPNTTFALPEATAGTVTNDWRWVYDWRANASPYTATLRKSKAGDLVLTRRMENNLKIDDGTLWLDTTRDGGFTYSRTISGEGGTLGKRGTGKLVLGGTFSLASQRPVHVSGGELQWDLANTLPAGSTIVVDGGILTYNSADGEGSARLPDVTIEISNGGLFRCGGVNKLRQSIPTVYVTGAGSAVETKFSGLDHPHFGPVTLRDGAELRITGPAAAAYPAYNHQGFVLHGSLRVESGDCAIVLSGNKPNGLALSEEDSEIFVADGATLTSNAMVSGVNLTGDAPRKLIKQGAGTWIQTVPLAWRSGDGSGSTFIGTPMDIKGGTFRYRLGGTEHTMSSSVSDAPFTIYEGGRFEGNVRLPVASPVVVLKGGTLAPWLNDVKNSGMSIGKLTCEDGAVLDFDMANSHANTALTVPSTGSVSFTGTLTVRLSNLPATLTEARKLTNFQVQPTGSPTIICPEAVALDAKVVLEARGDGETISNLWLVPSGASYIWANQSGNWADATWTLGSESSQSFPYHATSTETTPVARIQATSDDVALAVNGQNGTTNGASWLAKGLVFSINEGRTATLTEALSAPVAASDTLNRLCIDGALWKIGKGTATLSAPVEFYGMGTDGTLNVAGGTLALTHPFLSQSANADTSIKRTQLPLAIDIASGSTLHYALKPLGDYSAEEQGAISDYDPAEQVITGAFTGTGTLEVAGATRLTLKGAVAEGAVNYAVRSGASLTLANDIPASALAAQRTATVDAGGTLAATSSTAFGSAKWTLILGPDATAGAMVQTSANTAFRGTVKIAGTSGTATFGTATGAFDGDVTFETPAGTELAIGGSWSGGQGTVGSFTKRGTGSLAFTGSLMANYPMTIAEGTVRFTGTGSVFAPDDFNEAATQADWVVAPGATLAFDAAANVDTNGGSITLRAGATLALANGGSKFTGPVTFDNGAAVTLSGVGQPTTFNSAVILNGTVGVNLDALDPATLGNAGQAVYTLFSLPNDLREGTGTFQLAGNKLVAWTQAGWTLTDRGGTVTLEAFGGTAGAYTWAGDADASGMGNWQQKARWVAPHATEYSLWPTDDVTNPAVLLQDTDPLSTANDLIPAAARTLDWSGGAQTLGGLRCNNDSALAGETPDYTLTAKAAGATLTLDGDLLKSGAGSLVIERPVAMNSGAIKLLGGETLFKGALKATTGDFNKPITLGGNATLAFDSTAVNYALKGLLTGDGTGKIRFNGTGILSIASALDEVESLTLERGTVTLQAAEQATVAPRVTLANGATLTYAPSMLKAGGPVTMAINATDGTAPAGTLVWRATASNETVKVPVLAAPVGHAAAVPAVNVQALTYWPLGGRLVVNPGQQVLPSTVALTLSNSSAPTTALWVGAENPAAAETLTVAKLSGAGRLGVEPRVDATAGAWATARALTLAPLAGADDFTFGGTFAGALADDGTAITLGLTVTAPADVAAPRITLSGDSTDEHLGTLTLGERTHVEVSGTWAGDVSVAAGAKLSGSGTVGATGHTVTAPAGAKLSATVFGARQLANGTIAQEVIPATLTVAGTLDMKPHAILETMIRQDYATGKPWVSCIQVDTLQLPLFLDDADNNVVSLDVVVDDEAGVVASNVKVLGWNTLSGVAAISGRVLNPDGTERTDYFLRKRDDGLYLQRSNARFWLFIR